MIMDQTLISLITMIDKIIYFMYNEKKKKIYLVKVG